MGGVKRYWWGVKDLMSPNIYIFFFIINIIIYIIIKFSNFQILYACMPNPIGSHIGVWKLNGRGLGIHAYTIWKPGVK